MSTAKSRVERATYWRKQIETWEGSGESQQGFCRARGLNYPNFQYWRRKFAGETRRGQGKAGSEGGGGFVAVESATVQKEDSGLTLVLPSGAELRGITAANLVVVERLLRIAS